MHRVVLAALALVLALAACGNGAGPDRADPTDAPPTDAPPTDAPPDGAPTDAADDPETVAIADLAAHIGVDPADIEVVEHAEVTWRDGSMGCPKPGESYTQALVDGYRIVLRAGGEDFSYHGARDEPPFRCDDPDPGGTVDGSAAGAGALGDATGPPSPADDTVTKESASPPADPLKEDVMDEDGPLAQAIADLASHAGVDPDDIDVVANEQVTWRDGSLGCPKPGMMYTQALVDGYRIMLRANGENFSYHGARDKEPFRCDNPDPNRAVTANPDR